METYEYHRILKYLYFEGYADSYKEAEELVEELTDDEFDFLYEEVFGIDNELNEKRSDISYAREAISKARQRHKEHPKGHKGDSTKHEYDLSKKAFKNLVSQERSKRTNEEYDVYDIVLSHLIYEGYAEDLDSAYVILENMSEGWKTDVLKSTLKTAGKVAKKLNQSKLGKKAKKFVARTALGAMGVPLVS